MPSKQTGLSVFFSRLGIQLQGTVINSSLIPPGDQDMQETHFAKLYQVTMTCDEKF